MATSAAVIPATQQIKPPADCPDQDWLADRVLAARAAQRAWSCQPIRRRLRVLRTVRHQLAAQADQLVAITSPAHENGPTETFAGQLIPLADACRFLEKEACRVLAPRRLSAGDHGGCAELA